MGAAKYNPLVHTKISWTNTSVKRMAGGGDPVKEIQRKIHKQILDAMDEGWTGPPYDPTKLAEIMGIKVIPNQDIPDAQLVPRGGSRLEIEFNPNQPRSRIRFSLAHEIAHTMFPDHAEAVRHRSRGACGDDWQVEMLCNLAAAQVLMPADSKSSLRAIRMSMENAVRAKNMYEASFEAVLLRMVGLTKEPAVLFAAARRDGPDSTYRIEYAVNSPASAMDLPAGSKISQPGPLAECTAVGHTAGPQDMDLPGIGRARVECVGVPPYCGSSYPRVLCIARSGSRWRVEPKSVAYLTGDVTEPRKGGFRIISHLVNDRSVRWTSGLGGAISGKWPGVQASFRAWAESRRALGRSHYFPASQDLGIFSMVAQSGYGPSARPRIRYGSLAACLEELGEKSAEKGATVHMPRIGAGFAQGDWRIIEGLVDKHLVKRGLDVTVYDLPGAEVPRANHRLTDYTEGG